MTVELWTGSEFEHADEMRALRAVLAQMVDPTDPYGALAGLPVVVTHVKPVFQRVEPPLSAISRQLAQINDLGIDFIFPYQGMRIDFRVR